jgi:hypothetical protein
MKKAWRYSSGSVINPSRLKELVSYAEERGATLRSALHTLIDRAIGIAALPAATMTGVRAKLDLIYADAWSADEHFGTDYPPLIAVLNSAMRDIARIQSGARLNPPSLKEALGASLHVKGIHNG